MNILRLYCPLLDAPTQCDWALLGQNGKSAAGRSALKELPRRVDRVQLIVRAQDALIAQTRLPAGARRTASVLAFAVEDQTLGEPDANQATWLGNERGNDAIAVLDKRALDRWRKALGQAGIRSYEVQSESLLLPWSAGEWSVAWNGTEGFIRTGKFESAASDLGNHNTPPLSLRLMLENAKSSGSMPGALALYTTTPDALPDLDAWGDSLGLQVRHAGSWDWRTAAFGGGITVAPESSRLRGLAEVVPRLRLAAWITAIALALHALALVVDWSMVAREQQRLRAQMDARFRSTFPDAVAVVDPLLQMRRKLAEARHVAGQTDAGDFLPMIEKVASETKVLPVGSIRTIAYESGRLTVEITGAGDGPFRLIADRLRQAGFSVDATSSGGRSIMTVRAS